jgi:hypothetical protein
MIQPEAIFKTGATTCSEQHQQMLPMIPNSCASNVQLGRVAEEPAAPHVRTNSVDINYVSKAPAQATRGHRMHLKRHCGCMCVQHAP